MSGLPLCSAQSGTQGRLTGLGREHDLTAPIFTTATMCRHLVTTPAVAVGKAAVTAPTCVPTEGTSA